MRETFLSNLKHNIICICLSLLHILADVLSEDTIIKWYKGAHSTKGKNVFLEQMKKMVEWLQSAEEGRPAKSPQLPSRKDIYVQTRFGLGEGRERWRKATESG